MNHMGSINNPRVATNNKRFGRGRHSATAPEHYRPAGGGAWGEPPGRSVGKASRRIFVPWNSEKTGAPAMEQMPAARDCPMRHERVPQKWEPVLRQGHAEKRKRSNKRLEQ
jgi:hypothetical protein